GGLGADAGRQLGQVHHPWQELALNLRPARVRRMKFAARLLAGLVLALLALVAVGGAMSAARQPPLRGRMIDIGGRSLHLVCAGPESDSPTVILEAGAFGLSADWGAVQEELA